MNMNDLRASAYANGMGKSSGEKNSEKTDSSKNSGVKPFVPPRIKKLVSEGEGGKAGLAEKTPYEKPVFKDVNREIGKIFENRKPENRAAKKSAATSSDF